jgi:hypothetical protein
MLDNSLILPNGKKIVFNEEQTQGLIKIQEWLYKRDGINCMTLSGFAGTGKSTIIKKILDKYRLGVVVTAPTHKAKKVISNTTDKEGKTLHGLLGLRPDVELSDFNPNEPQFSQIAAPRINDYNLVIVDEASMINKELYKLILDQIKDTKTKVLFMGDSAQLPPVGEDISQVFLDKSIGLHQLTKIERQKDTNPLLLTFDFIRNNLDSIDGGFKRKTNINDFNEGIFFTNSKIEFRDKIFKLFNSEEYKKNNDYCKGLAWKNETVMESNKTIRNNIFGNGCDFIEIGDVLMGYRTITDAKMRYNIIENSADYQIVNKTNRYENSFGIGGYKVKLREDLGRGEFSFKDIFIIDINNRDDLHTYAQMHDYYRDIAMENKTQWKKYYDFRRENVLLTTIDKYINGVSRPSNNIINKDMDYGYFITVHKSQGSTYNNVCILDNDLNDNWNVVERNKLRYVAMSRPTQMAYVLSNRIDD